jgi:hypothetical protein
MKLTKAFKEAKPQVTEIDDASLALTLDLLYNPSAEQVSTVAAAIPEEPREPKALKDIRASYTTPEEFSANYKPQINKLLDGIITLCDKPDLNLCRDQFTKLKANRAFNSPMSYSENEVSQYKIQNLVKCSLENIYYQMHHNKKTQLQPAGSRWVGIQTVSRGLL